MAHCEVVADEAAATVATVGMEPEEGQSGMDSSPVEQALAGGNPASGAGADAMDIDVQVEVPHPIGHETIGEAVLTDAIEAQVLNSSKLLASADQLVADEPGWLEVAEEALPENAGHMSVSLQRNADGLLMPAPSLRVIPPVSLAETEAEDQPIPGHKMQLGMNAPELQQLAARLPNDALAAADPDWKPPSSAEQPQTKSTLPVRVQRVQRQLKRKRDAEFLYEGDEDWETLIERGKAGHRRNLLGGIAITGARLSLGHCLDSLIGNLVEKLCSKMRSPT